jgi:molybdate transport system substrate-binding protein
MEDLLSTARVAVADPSHVPAGRYSKAALECLGLWDKLSSRIIPTSDVRAALAAATTGSVDASIVYATDAAIVEGMEAFVLPVPHACQPAIAIDLVALPGSHRESWRESFGRFLLSNDNAGTWESFGFVPIGGSH